MTTATTATSLKLARLSFNALTAYQRSQLALQTDVATRIELAHDWADPVICHVRTLCRAWGRRQGLEC